MSDEKRVPGTKTATTTQTETRTKVVRHAFGASPRKGATKLTAKEEQILRMRYGIAAGPDMELEFEGQENASLRVELARMERRAMEMIGRGQPRRPPEPRKDSTKARIIEKLRDL